jgi:hypothetical protein
MVHFQTPSFGTFWEPFVAKILISYFFFGGGEEGSATPCASPPPCPSIFSNYSFWVHHPVNRDDRHLLAFAMASDFSAAWQFLLKRIIDFLLHIKLHTLNFAIFN